MARYRTCDKRERPNTPLTLRLDYDKADIIAELSEQTGKPMAAVLETMVLYALQHVRVADVVTKALVFTED